jgi:iron complex outermembrane receptor protein
LRYDIGQATGFVGASVSYVGLRESGFQSSSATPRFQYPAYTTINMHAGARYESWLFNLFVNNVGDKRGILGGNTGYGIGSSGYYAAIIQPRTVGLDISKQF